MSISKLTVGTLIFTGFGLIIDPTQWRLAALALGSYLVADNLQRAPWWRRYPLTKHLIDLGGLVGWRCSSVYFGQLAEGMATHSNLLSYLYGLVGWYSSCSLGMITLLIFLDVTMSLGLRFCLNSLSKHYQMFTSKLPADALAAWRDFLNHVLTGTRLINIKVGQVTIYSNTVQVPLAKETLEELAPLRCPGLNNVGENTFQQTECSICMEVYTGKELCRVLPCGHGFHATCVDDWLLKQSAACPICKKELSK